MTQLLMPKASAVWLIDNTSLSFDQIADFCSLHPLEVQSIADGEAGIGIQGYDPVQNGQLTQEELDRCQNDPTARLVLAESDLPTPNRRTRAHAMCRLHGAATSLMALPGWLNIIQNSRTRRL